MIGALDHVFDFQILSTLPWPWEGEMIIILQEAGEDSYKLLAT